MAGCLQVMKQKTMAVRINKLYKLPLGIFIAITVKIEGIKIQLNTKGKALNEHNSFEMLSAIKGK